eukprot:m.49888 g.49888  ORF g.49888 m.49888 type:complete len:459 (-) comp15342_c0_seq9:1606-2982(-)
MWAALAGVAVVFLSKAYLFSTKYNRAAADRTVLGLNILLLSESATKSTRETSDTTGGPCADVAYTRFHDTDTAARASVEDKPPRMHSTADDVREGVSTSGQRYKTITAKGMDRLNLEAGMALFFGAFAYFAVNFFFAPDREIADPYLLFCSISFVSSYTLVCIRLFVSLFLRATRRTKAVFDVVNIFFRFGHVLFFASVTSFLVAFSMIGYVKTINDFQDYAIIMLTGGVGGSAVIVRFAYSVLLKYSRAKQYARAIALGEHLQLRPPPDTDTWATDDKHANSHREERRQKRAKYFDYERMFLQIKATATLASFIVGNVFFEILFAVSGPYAYANYPYFVCATLAFVSGAIVLTTSTIIYICAKSEDKVAVKWFGRSLKNTKATLFYCFNLMLFAWMSSLVTLGAAKYTEPAAPGAAPKGNWGYSFGWGIFGIGCILISSWRIKHMSEVTLLEWYEQV